MTLQQQYNLIKEGKGNKDFFLKQARHLFPEYLTVHNTYEQTIGILQGKSIISEAAGGVVTLDNKKPDWFKIFNENLSSPSDTPKHIIMAQLLGPDFFLAKKPESQWDNKDHDLFNRVFKMASEEGKVPKLNEAIGVKNTKEYGDQNEFEKIDSETQKTLDKTNFDYKDPKNIDNIYGQTFLNGYYTEMKDPKNSEKTVDELKQIVAKNLAKDINYYVKDGAFGVKGLGYQETELEEVSGKYASSGYSDKLKKMVKESLVKEEEGKDYTKLTSVGVETLKKVLQQVDKINIQVGPMSSTQVKNEADLLRVLMGELKFKQVSPGTYKLVGPNDSTVTMGKGSLDEDSDFEEKMAQLRMLQMQKKSGTAPDPREAAKKQRLMQKLNMVKRAYFDLIL
jgi:hypothetical protein